MWTKKNTRNKTKISPVIYKLVILMPKIFKPVDLTA